MVDHHFPTNLTSPFMTTKGDFLDSASSISGNESVFPASTLSPRSDLESSSDMTSLLLTTAPSTKGTSFLDESGFHLPTGNLNIRDTVDFEKWTEHDDTHLTTQGKTVSTPRSQTPSPGISKMLLSLSDHPVERPCSPSASSLYRNTKTHCNPSELGQQTYDECMKFTRWANAFLQHSQDQFLITDLVRDLGDGITLFSLVEMLVGECPPQLHIKPALDVQKMENIQTCLDFLEHYGVSVNGITADDIVRGNLKVVLALCHSLYRHVGSSGVSDPQITHQVDNDELSLFSWVSKVTGKDVVDYQSFQDGTILCLLLNKTIEGVIPSLVLEFGSASEKLCLALKVSAEQLLVEPRLKAESIMDLRHREHFMEYLKLLYRVYINKSKKAFDAFEQRNTRRELKRQLVREQKLRSERYGSDLTYLGELSQDKSRIAREKLQISLANTSRGLSSNESLVSQRRLKGHESGDLSPLTNGSQNLCRSGVLNNTKRKLDDLKKELELLKVELREDTDEKYSDKSYLRSNYPSRDYFTSGLREPISRRKQASTRLELRHVFRGQGGTSMDEKTLKNGHNSHVAVERTKNVYDTDSGSSKHLFTACYLGDIPRSFDDSCSRVGLGHRNDGMSVTLKETIEQPTSSIHKVTSTFPREDPDSKSVFPSQPSSRSLCHDKPHTVGTKEISNLFDVDFGNAGEDTGGDRETSVFNRMLRAGSDAKLEGSNLRYDLDSHTVRSLSQGSYKPGAQAKASVANPYRMQEREKVLDKSFGLSLSTKPVRNAEKVNTMEKPSIDAATNGPTIKPRTLSKNKRHSGQVVPKNPAKSNKTPSTKSHLHALTALIRMSAKNASAMFEEEPQ
ncbi:uncharacterized protein LOC111325666 [Stylophora pistillata]|uniref:Neuron navigator 3 n=1 Tax=Stylophora pistillata TaxID=50429 RepID=A0A2B4SHM4_STYPI|nr:uncharacterized protein LOC111325666 [Stylophora pistillata]XP_022785251.1 uncharacterized protein LOC111325666 [Stylophora pistillata]XP_022785252.1 uncharacterized protein LOC111325666 [Stylophora pistillata]XP_022785253.1 uncharacterized protein LOC111325666 [Stylophora pistillata]PFX28886.1 Neuron navigator 3 [Stylophora pistillata]